MLLLDDIMAHAAECAPHEACGLVVASGKKHRLIKARNLSNDPRNSFALDPEAWLEVGERDAVVGIYHSHTVCSSAPSMADLSACEQTRLPWYIVAYPGGDHHVVEPSGFEAPYVGRPYVYGVHDCWTVVRDWYTREWSLDLHDFMRIDRWWLTGGNLFVDNFAKLGFVALPPEAGAEEGDAFLMQVNSPVPNHCAVFLADGTILHHVEKRLSTRDVWGGFWAKHCTHHLRHKSKMGST